MYENSKWWRPVDQANCTRESLERDHGVAMHEICTIPYGLTKHVKQLHDAAELNHCRVQNVYCGLEQLTNEHHSGANAPRPKQSDIVVFTDKGVITAVFVIDSITAVPERADAATTLRDPNPAPEPHDTAPTLHKPQWWVATSGIEDMHHYTFEVCPDIDLARDPSRPKEPAAVYNEHALTIAHERDFQVTYPKPGDLMIVDDHGDIKVYRITAED